MRKRKPSKFRMTAEPSISELPIAGVIPKPATSREYRTGEWRSFRPILDKSKCVRCGLCWIYCPDAAIKLRDDGSYEIDLTYCKGCGICAEECPPKAIKMVEEEVE